jgi:ubiquinone/menaquinone biosynthesis C-methylase UbiE
MPDSRYQASLDAYIEDSTEQETISKYLESVVVSLLDHRAATSGFPVKWLDVGAGDGKKLFAAIAKISEEWAGPEDHLLDVTLLDRDNFERQKLPNVSKATLRRVTGQWPVLGLEASPFDLVTMIHSAYQFPGSPEGLPDRATVAAIARCLRREGLLMIVHEAEISAFQRFKAELYQEIGPPAPVLVTADGIRRSLEAEGFRIKFSCRLEQTFTLRDEMLDPYSATFPYFLFETATTSCDAIPPAVAESAARWLRKERDARGPDFRVDDCVIIAEPRRLV